MRQGLTMALQRSRTDTMIAGVCGGIAAWLGWDATVVRVLYVVVSVISAAFPGILVYVLLWVVMPKAPADDVLADRSWAAENRTERERLRALVARLGEDDLRRPMSGGWTVAAVLAHLAFWDQRILVLLQQWDRTGRLPRSMNDADVDWINDAGKPLCLALAPRDAARLAVTAADAVDAAVEALPDDRLVTNASAGRPLNLRRAEHRREHLDEIEAALR
jgi:phage shock protein C